VDKFATESFEDSMASQPSEITTIVPFPATKDRLLPLKEAAERLGVSLRTLEDWIYDKRITTVKLGRCRRIKESTLDAIIETNTRPAKSRLL